MDERRIPGGPADGAADPDRAGAVACSPRSAKPRSAPSRLLSFLGGSAPINEDGNAAERKHLASLTTDVASLIDHSGFLADNLIFLLDASLGLISVEQNAGMKLFSWVALVFLPPTLVAGVFGMNFDYMPELEWPHGYPLSLALMLASAVLPCGISSGAAGFSRAASTGCRRGTEATTDRLHRARPATCGGLASGGQARHKRAQDGRRPRRSRHRPCGTRRHRLPRRGGGNIRCRGAMAQTP